ncbi:hypothetical protein [Donghicola tyrosinivorans]|uniref:Uncharacterized protein n=1 Tax=Donghicola tyrosinivorans TaxID=1652492 RepID=A0A2T0WJD8_9RHOB|nr:hypothetical protein [Donghicola tyrosinivorans]PRY86772.1 hypothetical protein CLV74_1111 [Donghicola tyrosinivorans]
MSENFLAILSEQNFLSCVVYFGGKFLTLFKCSIDFLEDWQTFIVGVFAFLGVTKTLKHNAKEAALGSGCIDFQSAA